MTKAPRLVIVADDLTGAADSAARCVQAGLSAEISLEASPQPGEADVVALSTDSRFLSPEEAAQRVAAALAARHAWPGSGWYKKIDSTLRGNLGAELDAMLAALPHTIAVICPAFPAQARGLEHGNLVYGNAQPRHLPSLLSEQSALGVEAIGLAAVRAGRDALSNALQAARAQGKRLVVVDGMRDDDLATIVAATEQDGFLLCGSAGLVAPLAARLAVKPPEPAKPSPIARGPILAVVGSGSHVAHAQVVEVARAKLMRTRCLDNTWYAMDLAGAQAQPVGDWLIHLAQPEAGALLEGAVARAQAARLADIAYAAVGTLQPAALFLVGGDTAYFVLRRLGIKHLSVAEELLPGIALTRGVDRAGVTRAAILKPGNFGDEQTLVALHAAVRQRQS